ncbi:MAG TPA: tetratricopeptide repeat protein [Candidatus Sulfomarinibacteraceae bacterium]|nr:tetratricopeptide repeat protein [Candidatus Sulfomarinibacteraceae bacterium]
MIELLLAAERLLAAGRLDQAERLFEQVAVADPRNAIAVVGLARVAAARGDEAGSAALAHRALGIDPDDVAAAHLLASLEMGSGTPREGPAEPPPPPEPEPPPALGAEPQPLPGAARRAWWQRILDFVRGR